MYACDIPQFSDSVWCGKYLKDNKYNSVYLTFTTMLEYYMYILSLDITLFVPQSSQFSLLGPDSAADKYPRIFSVPNGGY